MPTFGGNAVLTIMNTLMLGSMMAWSPIVREPIPGCMPEIAPHEPETKKKERERATTLIERDLERLLAIKPTHDPMLGVKSVRLLMRLDAGRLDSDSPLGSTLGWSVSSKKADGTWRLLRTIERGKDDFAWTDDVALIPKEDLVAKGDRRSATLRAECWITESATKTRVTTRESERTFVVVPNFATIKKPIKKAEADAIVGSIEAIIEEDPMKIVNQRGQDRGLLRLTEPFVAWQKLAAIGVDTLGVRLSLRLGTREIWSSDMWWGRVPAAWRSGDTHNHISGLVVLSSEVRRLILGTDEAVTLTISGSREAALRDVVGTTYWDGEVRIPVKIKRDP
jgi:hypothetical protein